MRLQGQSRQLHLSWARLKPCQDWKAERPRRRPFWLHLRAVRDSLPIVLCWSGAEGIRHICADECRKKGRLQWSNAGGG